MYFDRQSEKSSKTKVVSEETQLRSRSKNQI